MGVPGLYRWLVDRYPKTLCCVAEERSNLSMGPKIDLTTPNPNGVEFDNLYIDMNGVIHPCFHPEGLPGPESYDDVLKSIFRYLDRVFSIIRPRKLLFLAVDGVAPRAKINHQRVRRFRAAREAAGKSKGDKKLDSNVITPGTEFMDQLSSALTYFVYLRMEVDPAWRRIKVILSDSTVVGEGEDKILTYIRSQRNLPGYDPNTRHCLHGLDADLIILALATHEIHISILREVETYSMRMKKKSKGDRKPLYNQCMRYYIDHLKFEFFNIWVLREYIERELLPRLEGTDFERIIDDFVFFCLFAGNDYIPHLPSLDVFEGGIGVLMSVYQEEFAKMGHLTDSSKVNLKSMQHFVQALSYHENAIFSKRCQHPTNWEAKRKRTGSQDSVSDASVNMHEKYTKPNYYTRKFDCEPHDVDRIKRDAVLKYTEGVCWMMHCYYQRVCSWQWFYPYHYAPFASDFCGLDELEINFTLGQPFKPLDQLLGVLPAASAHALPPFYRELMTEESSPILDFYPEDVKIDYNGKKRAWQGVCKLPFIDESRLVSEIAKVEHTLTAKEKQRNTFRRDRLFVHKSHPLAKVIQDDHPTDPTSELQIQISPELSGGMNGYLFTSKELALCHGKVHSPIAGKEDLIKIRVKSFYYKCPSHAPHIPKLLCGVMMPPKILRSQDTLRPLVVWRATSIPSEISETKQQVSQDIRNESEVDEKSRNMIQGTLVEKDEDKKGKQEKKRVRCDEVSHRADENSIDEKPKGEEVDLLKGTDIILSKRKRHKKRSGGEVIEKKESHDVVEEMEGDVRKKQVDDGEKEEMVEGGGKKSKKQKKSKHLEDEKSDGEKTKEEGGESERKKQESDGEKSKNSSEIVDGENEEHHHHHEQEAGESERKKQESDGEKSKKKSSEIVEGENEEHHHHHEQQEGGESEDNKRKKQKSDGEKSKKKKKKNKSSEIVYQEAGESEDTKRKKPENEGEKSKKKKKHKSFEILDGENEEHHHHHEQEGGASERKKQESDAEKSKKKKKSSEVVDVENEEHHPHHHHHHHQHHHHHHHEQEGGESERKKQESDGEKSKKSSEVVDGENEEHHQKQEVEVGSVEEKGEEETTKVSMMDKLNAESETTQTRC